jgi:hypothetical protein
VANQRDFAHWQAIAGAGAKAAGATSTMVPSALIAFFLGPAWGFIFAGTMGPAFGWVFAAAYAGRAAELEARADRAMTKLHAQGRALLSRRRLDRAEPLTAT